MGWGCDYGGGSSPPDAARVAALCFIGYGSISFDSLAKTALQLLAPPAMRGSVHVAVGHHMARLDSVGDFPVVGWMDEEFGARWSLIVGGIPALAVSVLACPVLARIRPGAESGTSVLTRSPVRSGPWPHDAYDQSLESGSRPRAVRCELARTISSARSTT